MLSSCRPRFPTEALISDRDPVFNGVVKFADLPQGNGHGG